MKARICKPQTTDMGCNTPNRKARIEALQKVIMMSMVIQPPEFEEIIADELNRNIPQELVTIPGKLPILDEDEDEDELLALLKHCAIPDAVYYFEDEEGDPVELRARVLDNPKKYHIGDDEGYVVAVIDVTDKSGNKSFCALKYNVDGEEDYDISTYITESRYDELCIKDIDIELSNEDVLREIFNNAYLNCSTFLPSEYISAWYTINNMLLNPLTKVVESTGTPKSHANKTQSHHMDIQKQPLIYIHHIGNRKADCNHSRINERHTDAWFRIGHIRHLKNGKQVFVKSCVCGPKKDDLTIRNRIIERNDNNGID